jgi:hypothetical protein
MIVLAASDTLAAGASVASMLTSTVFGMTLNNGVETYAVLDQRQLASSPATIYTVAGSTTAFIRTITVVNNDTINRTFQYFRGSTAAANAITPAITLLPSGYAIYEDGTGWQVYNSSGQLLQSQYSVISPIDNWGITNCKGETMDRNICPEVNTTVTTTGQIYLQAIWLTAGTVISNISFFSATTAASVPTHYCFALYDINRNLLATTADQTSTAWAANTIKTLAVNSAYTVTTTGLYYLAFMMTATTIPTLKGGTARTNGNLSFTAPIISGVSGTTYSTGTASASVNAIGAAVTTSIWGCVT